MSSSSIMAAIQSCERNIQSTKYDIAELERELELKRKMHQKFIPKKSEAESTLSQYRSSAQEVIALSDTSTLAKRYESKIFVELNDATRNSKMQELSGILASMESEIQSDEGKLQALKSQLISLESQLSTLRAQYQNALAEEAAAAAAAAEKK